MSQQEQTKELPIDELRSQLEGEVILPDDGPYEEARRVFFKGFDRTPLAVAQPANADDVAQVVSTARDASV